MRLWGRPSLLSEYDIVVSDSEQTGDGQRFWLRMIDWAFSMNYRISVADGTVGEEWHLTPVSSYAELEERWIAFAWGHDRDVHPHRRLVISKA